MSAFIALPSTTAAGLLETRNTLCPPAPRRRTSLFRAIVQAEPRRPGGGHASPHRPHAAIPGGARGATTLGSLGAALELPEPREASRKRSPPCLPPPAAGPCSIPVPGPAARSPLGTPTWEHPPGLGGAVHNAVPCPLPWKGEAGQTDRQAVQAVGRMPHALASCVGRSWSWGTKPRSSFPAFTCSCISDKVGEVEKSPSTGERNQCEETFPCPVRHRALPKRAVCKGKPRRDKLL